MHHLNLCERLVFVVVCCVASVLASCPSASTPWSSWSNAPTSSGSSVVIAQGESILLDVSNVVVSSITIRGKLVFDKTKSKLVFTSGLIYVDGGELWVGSEDCFHTNTVEIILTGQPPTLPLPSNKAISVTNGGKLNIHGAETTSWTNITQSAQKGDSYILVNSHAGWSVGDTLYIAPTAFFVEELEVRTIDAINGNNITLNSSLNYYHHSDFYRGVNGEVVEMRAEVAKLERSVTIRGDGTSDANQFGGTIICYSVAQCKFSYVLFREMGHQNFRGRYAVHYHQLGDIHGGWAKGNIVFNSYNRAYVVHGTNHTLVEDNVAIQVKGHTYFIEDGNEFYNRFIGNLALDTRNMIADLTGGDKSEPSSFWITNPYNYIVGNHAVGAVFGFWYAMPFHPIGLGSNFTDMWPMFLPVLEFDSNVAHTMKSDGLFVDRGVQPDNSARDGTFYRPSRFDYITSLQNKGDRIGSDSEPGVSYFVRYLGYKNNGMGAWMRGYNMEFHYSSFIDNGVGVEFAGGNNRVVHGFIVGLSDNWGTNRPYDFVDYTIYGYSWYNAVGFHFYHGGGPTHVVHTTFQNFADVTLPGLDYFGNPRIRRGWAIYTDTGGTAYPSHDRFYNITFYNVSHKAYFNVDHDKFVDKTQCELSPILIDIDGSLTGTCGSWLVGAYNPLMRTPLCTKDDTINGYVCPPSHSPIRMFEVVQGGGNGGTITRLYDGAQLNTSQSDWSFNVVTNADYFMRFGKDVQPRSDSPSTLQFRAPLMQVGEYINLVIPYKPGSRVNKVFATDSKYTFVPAASKSALNGFNYYWDSAAGLFYIKYITPADSFQYQKDTVFALNSWSAFQGYQWLVTIEMDCGGSCTHTANPASLSGAYVPKSGKYTTCGDLLAGGLPKWTEDTSVAPYVIFDTALQNNWTSFGATVVDNDISIPATGTTKLLYGSQKPVFYFDSTVSLDVSQYTHLAMDILVDRNTGGRTRACILVNSQNRTTQLPLLGTDTDMCNPFYTPFPPYDIWEWRTVHVPLADLRKPTDPAVIERLGITTGGQYPYRPTAWYLANIKLVKGTNVIQDVGNNKWFLGKGGDPDPMPWAPDYVSTNLIKVGERANSKSPEFRLGPATPDCFWPYMLDGTCTPKVISNPSTIGVPFVTTSGQNGDGSTGVMPADPSTGAMPAVTTKTASTTGAEDNAGSRIYLSSLLVITFVLSIL